MPSLARLVPPALGAFLALAGLAAPRCWADEPAPLPPGGLSPAAAIAKMKLAEGFEATAYAHEPDLVQPMAFCFDERGRLWIAENLNYQTRGSHLAEPISRISIYQDVDGDGRFDKKKLFIDKIFFPSGLERGFGGVWVGSPPNLLFIPDRNDDDLPDGPPEVVVDGWGMQDRHETINSFTWGPDGWLYGCHGVFTQANVGDPKLPKDSLERVKFNAGWWRLHPVTRKFELFAEGASNQWAITFDDHGQAFGTACVIPHLWHVIQGARYQRQAGPHTLPYTYDDIKTIADHKHASAHGGARVYLADQFPPEWRGRIIMGNIHEHAILSDELKRKGSGFVGSHGPNLFDANDNLFIPFQMELGPEGAIYLLDWYDRDICGRKIDEEFTGRVYRVTHGACRTPTDLALGRLTDDELVKLHLHPNDWHARQARRLLHERAAAGKLAATTPAALTRLLAETPTIPKKLRALWSLHCVGGVTPELGRTLLAHDDEYLRAWAIQLLCENGQPSDAVLARFAEMAKSDSSQLVRKYLASALQRLPLESRWPIVEHLLGHAEDADDHNLPLLYWYGLEPLVMADKARAAKLSVSTKIPLTRQFIARRLTEGLGDSNKPRFGAVLEKVAAGFDVRAVGEGGVEYLADHFGRPAVRTHPLDQETPCVLARKLETPVNKITKLRARVSHDPRGDWLLVVRVDRAVVKEQLVAESTVTKGWLDVEVDLTPYKGKTILLELENRPNNWRWEFAYWGSVEIQTD